MRGGPLGPGLKGAISVLVLLIIASPTAMGVARESTDAIWIEIVIPDKEWDEGDVIDISMHVFDEGEYSDVDVLEAYISDYVNDTRLESTRVSMGIWECSFVVEHSLYENGGVYFFVNVTLNDESYEYYRHIWFGPQTSYDDLQVSHTVEPASVMVDDDVRTITWEVRYRGELVDPGSIEVMPNLNIWDLADDDPEVVRLSTGVYRSVVDVSDFYSHLWMELRSQVLEIRLSVSYQQSMGSPNISAYDHIYLYLNRFHVWTRALESEEEDHMRFEFLVTHLDGRPVKGAEIYIAYGDNDVMDAWTGEVFERNATTGEDGRVVMDFTLYEPLLEASRLLFRGAVKERWDVQDILFHVDMRRSQSVFEPDGWGCDFVRTNVQPFLMGSDVTLNATVYSDGDAWSGETYYLVRTPERLLANGRVVPDDSGNVSIAFHTPEGDDGTELEVTFTVKVETPAITWYRSRTEWYTLTTGWEAVGIPGIMDRLDDILDGRSTIVAPDVTLGRECDVSFSHPDAGESWNGWVIAGFDLDNPGNATGGSWFYASTSPVEGIYIDRCDRVGGSFEGSYLVPRGLPGEDLFLMGLMLEDAELEGDFQIFSQAAVRVAVLTGVEYREADLPEEEEDADLSVVDSEDIAGIDPNLYWTLAFLTIGLAVVSVILLLRRTKWGGDLVPLVRYGLVVTVLALVLVFASYPGSEYDIVFHGSFDPEYSDWPLEPVYLDRGEYTIWAEDPGVVQFGEVPISVDVLEVNEGFSYSDIREASLAGLDCVFVFGFNVDEPGNFTLRPSANPEVVDMEDIDLFLVKESSPASRLGFVGGLSLLVVALSLIVVFTIAKRYGRGPKGPG